MKIFKITKLIASTLVAASLIALNPIGASAEWRQDNIGWKWYNDDGTYAIGWQHLGGNDYYFYYGGYMAHDTFIDRNYYVGINGAWTTPPDDGRWIEARHITFTEKEITPEMAADLNRKLSSGLTLGEAEKKIENSLRKLAQSGTSLENMEAEVSKEAKKYGTTEDELRYITSTGNTAWIQNGTGWWFKEDNSYAIGWRWIDGQWYHFDTNGYMEHDKGVREGLSYYKLGSKGHIVGSTTSDPEFMKMMREANGYGNDTDTSASSQSTSTSTSSNYTENRKTDTSKVLSSGMTLKEAKFKIDSIIAGIEALGETVEENMDYINKLCESMGTTYDEIKNFKG